MSKKGNGSPQDTPAVAALVNKQKEGRPHTLNKQALVVDDNDINLMVIQEALRQFGLRVTTASSGQQAVQKAGEAQFDIVFMDHVMPNMDGLQTTWALRKISVWYQKIPIIALTANTTGNMRHYFIAQGLNDFMSKPIDINHLAQLLEKWLPAAKPGGNPLQPTRGADKESATNSSYPFANGNNAVIAAAQGCGLDILPAIDRLGGNREVYVSVLRAYCNTASQKIDAINRSVEQGDLRRYYIELHSQKSSLMNIGAHHLSETAGRLERAANHAEKAYISENTPAFVSELQALVTRLTSVLPANHVHSHPHPDATERQWQELPKQVRQILGLLQVLEAETITQKLRSLLSVNYTSKINKILEMVLRDVDTFNYDAASDHLRQVILLSRKESE